MQISFHIKFTGKRRSDKRFNRIWIQNPCFY